MALGEVMVVSNNIVPKNTLTAFSAPGKFYRGNLHTHSTRSDGILTPEDVCRRYRAEGYDFLALTDHFIGAYQYPIVDTGPFRGDGFTTILGAEVHSGKMENGELWHILAVGLPTDFAPSNSPGFQPVNDQETGLELAARAVAAGAFVAIAHPQWSGLTMNDARSLTAAHAVETYNHGCAMGCDRPDGFAVLDQLLAEGKRLNLIATDDAHFNEPDHFGGWVMVKSEANEPDDLLAALKRGDYYSSQGPELRNVTISETEVCVEMSACVSMIVSGAGSAARAIHGHSMSKAVLPLARFKNSPFIRITIIDAAGKRAWSNPHYF
jgi:predicted metal-dependent phosphoesterase TrpH